MIILLKKDAREDQILNLTEQLKEMGLESHLSVGANAVVTVRPDDPLLPKVKPTLALNMA